MPSRNQPTVRLRRIGSALRKAREANNLTVGAACRRYGRSKSWLSTLENGLHTVDPQELADLLDFYNVHDAPLRESLLHLATHNSEEIWRRARSGNISAAASDLASLEEDSALIRTFQPSVFPGLLQTREYMECIFEIGQANAVRNTETLIDFRISRQGVLKQPNPPRYVPLISESVLQHRVGDAPVMHAQIVHLSEVARLDHVELRVLPNSAGAHHALAGNFHLLSLKPPGQLTVSVIEQFNQTLFVENDQEVTSHQEIFEQLLAQSLDAIQSQELIEQIASVL
ncbi:helix-turn-helix domain-containing protein [Spirillospora sp. NBC_00431]